MSAARNVLAIAAFEAKLARRMIRAWVLGILVVLAASVILLQYLLLHRLASGFSGGFAFITRDFAVLYPGLMLGLLAGLIGIFYVFDWRHRDLATAFAPTYDAAPISRLQLAWGKFLGLSVVIAAPFAVLVVLQVAGVLIAGVRVSPQVFVLGDVVLGLLGALGLTAVAFGLAGLTGSRALAIVVSLAYLAGIIFGVLKLPERYGVYLGSVTEIPVWSDFIGYAPEKTFWFQRLAQLFLLIFFVSLAACGRIGLPRNAGSRLKRNLVVAGAFGAFVAATAFSGWYYGNIRTQLRAAVAAESAVAGQPEPVVVTRDVDVVLQPARRRLEGVARLALRNEGDAPLAQFHLRLNQGLKVEGVESSTGTVTTTRDHAVVTVRSEPPLAPGADVQLTVRYSGGIDRLSVAPDVDLGVSELEPSLRGNRRFIGTLGAILDRGAVALGTDAGWYPELGAVVGARFPGSRRLSFATGTLTVKLPTGWRAASVGKLTVDADGTHRFVAEQPVPGLSLNAAKYEEVAADIGGIKMRLLYHPKHVRNVAFFRESADLLKEHLIERLDEIRSRTGLSYPYPELTLVEVPQQFAAYGSGWDSPNRMAAPGVVMIRESGLLGARFEQAFKSAKGRFEKRAGGGDVSISVEGAPVVGEAAEKPPPAADLTKFDPARAKLDILKRFVTRDWAGGDIERLAFKSTWDHRLQAVGAGAPVIGYGLSNFEAELGLGRAPFDNPEFIRILNTPAMGQLIQATVSDETRDTTQVLVDAIANPDDVYVLMQEKPLQDMDPAVEGRKLVGVLHVKARQPLKALQETLGRERWNSAMASLLAAHGGGTFTWDDFRAAVLAQADPAASAQLEVLFDHWLVGTQLPGFVVSKVTATRLAGADERWQVVALVSNRGDAPGSAKLVLGKGADATSKAFSVDPGQDVEVGSVVPHAPSEWTLVPYLALNRGTPKGSVTKVEEAVAAEPWDGTRPAQVAGEGVPVVVDNLDAGFTVTVADGSRVPFSAPSKDGKGKLLADWPGFRAPSAWARWRSRGLWYTPFGLFDYTAAVKKGTEGGDHPAHWVAALPEAGTWRVEAFLPSRDSPGGVKLPATFEFVVHSESGDTVVPIKVSAAQTGWNDLGRFAFGTKADVELKDKGEGIIVADAIRFTKEHS